MACNDGGTGGPATDHEHKTFSTTVTVIQSDASFKQWYNDTEKINTKVVGTLELAQLTGTNQYQFSSSNGRTVYDDIHDLTLKTGVTSLTSGFFPLETTTRPKVCNLWPYWANGSLGGCVAKDGVTPWQQWDPRANAGKGGAITPVTGLMRNFYFTSEVRYLFRYAGGEKLSFFGDDDVWVFINGHLVLDLGAPHERMKGDVTLTATGATYAITAQNTSTGADIAVTGGSGTVANLGLEVGKTYEIAIFHADQHPRESNYQLTLSGYSTTRSVCVPRCGDGVATAGEECDLGAMNNDTQYGGCTTMCKFGPFCGDGTPNMPDEECDLGKDNKPSPYGAPGGCTMGCKIQHFCGDGKVDGAFHEECDAGAANSPTGRCTDLCKLNDVPI